MAATFACALNRPPLGASFGVTDWGASHYFKSHKQKHVTQVSLPQNNDRVQTLALERADQSLSYAIVPREPGLIGRSQIPSL
jgi:hypothetical protein